jgi:ABC-2 type transport system ATP-binding protein
MRQRLGIAMALLSQAEFLILDEPLNGLDPEGIVEVRNLILKLNKEFGITFLISSHILTELSLVATKYGIISKGHLIKEVTEEELKNQCEKHIKIETTDKEAIYNALLTLVDKENIKEFNNGYIIPGDIEYSSVLSHLQGLPITAINTETTSIEDYYLRIIKGGRNNA